MSQSFRMISYTSLSRVLITPISEQEVDERFRHVHQPYFPRILWENDFCVVMCASHDIAVTFMEHFRSNPGQEISWYLEDDEVVDPMTFPPPRPPPPANDAWLESFANDEDYKDEEDYYGCPVCRVGYMDSSGYCGNCEDERLMRRGRYYRSRGHN